MTIRAVAVDDEDAVRLVAAYYAELRERLPGFEPPPPEQRRRDAAAGVVLLAYDAAGSAVACGALRRLDPTTAEVKRMFVTPPARGHGIARKLLHALESAAQAMGCTRVVLDTAAPLTEARAMYLREGYAEIAAYNDNPAAAHWFEKRL